MIHINPIESFLLGDTHFCYSPREFKRAGFLLASTTVTVYGHCSFYKKELKKFYAQFCDHGELLCLFIMAL